MTKIVICTSSEHRHKYFYSSIIEHFNNVLVYSEKSNNKLFSPHFKYRMKIENELLKFKISTKMNINLIDKGEINSSNTIKEIIKFNPDLIITYGCSILNENFLKNSPGAKINIHLGLSPYYRGTATNFWPIYNNEMQFCGVTFHKLSNKIDAGEIYGQYSLEKKQYESVHHVGNTLIKFLPENTNKIILGIHNIKPVNQLSKLFSMLPRHYYRTKDFKDKHSKYVEKNFRNINDKFLLHNNNTKIVDLPS